MGRARSARWYLSLVALAGCRGENVSAAVADGATDSSADVAATDASSDDGAAGDDGATGDVAMSGCDRARGPTMVRVDASGTSYCIDTTEVTGAQFDLYLADPSKPFDAPTFCGAFASARPARNTDPTAQKLPARDVQWCWAHAYCKWAGKRLCGKIGGTGTDVPEDGRSEWTYACTNGALATRYPYGDTYDEAKCVTAPGPPAAPASTGSCHGTVAPFDRVHDLVGNVAELDGWVGFVSSGEAFSARTRGYAYGDGDHPCSAVATYAFATTFPQVGFRCCADPGP